MAETTDFNKELERLKKELEGISESIDEVKDNSFDDKTRNAVDVIRKSVDEISSKVKNGLFDPNNVEEVLKAIKEVKGLKKKLDFLGAKLDNMESGLSALNKAVEKSRVSLSQAFRTSLADKLSKLSKNSNGQFAKIITMVSEEQMIARKERIALQQIQESGFSNQYKKFASEIVDLKSDFSIKLQQNRKTFGNIVKTSFSDFQSKGILGVAYEMKKNYEIFGKKQQVDIEGLRKDLKTQKDEYQKSLDQQLARIDILLAGASEEEKRELEEQKAQILKEQEVFQNQYKENLVEALVSKEKANYSLFRKLSMNREDEERLRNKIEDQVKLDEEIDSIKKQIVEKRKDPVLKEIEESRDTVVDRLNEISGDAEAAAAEREKREEEKKKAEKELAKLEEKLRELETKKEGNEKDLAKKEMKLPSFMTGIKNNNNENSPRGVRGIVEATSAGVIGLLGGFFRSQRVENTLNNTSESREQASNSNTEIGRSTTSSTARPRVETDRPETETSRPRTRTRRQRTETNSPETDRPETETSRPRTRTRRQRTETNRQRARESRQRARENRQSVRAEIVRIRSGIVRPTPSFITRSIVETNRPSTETVLPVQSSTVLPVQSSTVRPSSTVLPVQSSIARPVQSSTVLPVQSSIARPVQSSTVLPVQSSTVRPVQSSMARPSSTVRPVQSSTTRPTTETVLPVQSSMARPSSTVRPVQSSTVLPVQSSMARPSSTVLPVQSSTIRPSSTVLPVQSSTVRPVQSSTVLPVQHFITKPAVEITKSMAEITKQSFEVARPTQHFMTLPRAEVDKSNNTKVHKVAGHSTGIVNAVRGFFKPKKGEKTQNTDSESKGQNSNPKVESEKSTQPTQPTFMSGSKAEVDKSGNFKTHEVAGYSKGILGAVGGLIGAVGGLFGSKRRGGKEDEKEGQKEDKKEKKGLFGGLFNKKVPKKSVKEAPKPKGGLFSNLFKAETDKSKNFKTHGMDKWKKGILGLLKGLLKGLLWMAKGLFKVVKKFGSFLRKSLSAARRGLTKVAKKIGSFAKNAVSKGKAGLSKVANKTGSLVKNIADKGKAGLSSTWKFIKKLGSPKVAGPLAGIMGGIDRFLEVKDDKNLNRGQKTAKIGASAIGAAGGAALGSLFGPIGTMVGGYLGKKLGDSVGDWLSDKMSDPNSTLTKTFTAIGDAFVWIWNKVQEVPKVLIDVITSPFTWIQKGISAIGAGIKKVWNFIKTVGTTIQSLTKLLLEAPGKFIKTVADFVTSLPGKLFDSITSIPLPGWVSKLTNSNTVGELFSSGANVVSNTASKVGNFVSSTASAAGNFISSTAGKVGNFVSSAASKVGNTVSSVASSIGSGISGAIDKIKSGLGFKKQSGVDLDNVNPAFFKNFQGMAADFKKATGRDIQVNSGYRDSVKQAQLYAENVKQYPPKGNGKVAPPGRSAHEKGLAMDINSNDANEADRLGLLAKWGIDRPLLHSPRLPEAWHIQPAGVNAKAAPPLKPVPPIKVSSGGGSSSDPNPRQVESVNRPNVKNPSEGAKKSASVTPSSSSPSTPKAPATPATVTPVGSTSSAVNKIGEAGKMAINKPNQEAQQQSNLAMTNPASKDLSKVTTTNISLHDFEADRMGLLTQFFIKG